MTLYHVIYIQCTRISYQLKCHKSGNEKNPIESKFVELKSNCKCPIMNFRWYKIQFLTAGNLYRHLNCDSHNYLIFLYYKHKDM